MIHLCSEVLKALQGRTLATAESCTGGGIGHAITAVSGSSAVFKGGIISYCNDVKMSLLGVDPQILCTLGAVSGPVAEQMASGARKALSADVAVSATGLADVDGDEFGHPGGTVFLGYSDTNHTFSREYHFVGDREAVRNQTIKTALKIVLEMNSHS